MRSNRSTPCGLEPGGVSEGIIKEKARRSACALGELDLIVDEKKYRLRAGTVSISVFERSHSSTNSGKKVARIRWLRICGKCSKDASVLLP